MAAHPPQPQQNPARIGMDVVKPYGVYLNGVLVAAHPTERAARTTFNKLTSGVRLEGVFVGQSR
jgi:hypothetical protein